MMKGCPNCGRRFSQGEEFCPDDGGVLADLSEAGKDLLVGTVLDGRYQIKSRLGEGGMGIVYLATHAVIGKRCAVKVLRADVNAESDMGERFIQEARSAAAIDNPHVIEITDFGQTPDGSAYFVMEFLDGKSLQAVLQEDGRFDTDRAFHIAEQCCEALTAAHEAGVVHRDLKPENLILVHRDKDADYVKVLDFGIAKVARETGRLTRTGTIFGTPQYMAPEQAAGTEMDQRVDIYSLGIILYEMLCGRVPFEADTFMGVLTKHLYEQPIPPSQVLKEGLPRAVESIILKALSKKPDLRYQSMGDMQADVRAVLEGRMPEAEKEEIAVSTMPPPPCEVVGNSDSRRERLSGGTSGVGGHRPLLLGIGAVAAVAVLGLGWWVMRAPQESAPPVSSKSDTGVTGADTSTPGTQATEKIALNSAPAGARVFLDKALVGVTPTSIPRPSLKQRSVSYRLQLEGYRDLDVLITAATPDTFTPALMPLPKVAPAIDTDSDTSGDVASEKSTERKSRKGRSRRSGGSSKRKGAGETPASKKKDRLGGDIVNPWGDS